MIYLKVMENIITKMEIIILDNLENAKNMEQVLNFIVMEKLFTRVDLQTIKEKVLENIIIQMVNIMLDNGKTIQVMVEVYYIIKMEILNMKVIL